MKGSEFWPPYDDGYNEVRYNTDAINDSKFTAIPGGNRQYGKFDAIGRLAYFFSSTEREIKEGDGSKGAYNYIIPLWFGDISKSWTTKVTGGSIRCMKN
jgi:hypothetical protein